MVGHQGKIKKTNFNYWMSAPHATAGKQSTLLIHGFGGTYSGLESLAGMLAEHSNVLGLDLPGYGLSEPLRAKHTLSNYAHFLDEFCATTEFHKVNVVGHSFGADIALVFAALHPDRVDKLVLISPVIFGDKNFIKLARYYYMAVAKMPPPLRHRLLHNHFLSWVSAYVNLQNADEETRAKILRDDYVSDHLMTDRPLIEGYFSLLATPFLTRAKQIEAPTFIISGDADRLSPVREMEHLQAAIPKSRLDVVSGAGHFLPIEEPRKVHNKIQKFFAE